MTRQNIAEPGRVGATRRVAPTDDSPATRPRRLQAALGLASAGLLALVLLAAPIAPAGAAGQLAGGSQHLQAAAPVLGEHPSTTLSPRRVASGDRTGSGSPLHPGLSVLSPQSPLAAGAVALALSPASKSAAPGDTFDLTVQVEAGAQQLDAVQVDITFPAALLEVVDASAAAGVQVLAGNTLPTLLQNTVDNTAGRIRYAAGVSLGSEARPSGTFLLATVQLRTKVDGTAQVRFGSDSKVSHAGENVTGDTRNAVVIIGTGSAPAANPTPAPSASAPSPPQVQGPVGAAQSANLGPTLRWSQPSGVTQFQVRVIPFNLDGPGINLIIGAAAMVALSEFRILPPDMAANANFVMLPGMTYRWQVRVATAPQSLSEDAPDWSGWTEGGFRTPLPSSATIGAASPAQGARVSSRTPRLSWTNSDPSIFYYEFQLSRDPAFTTDPAAATAAVYWELVHGGVTANSYTVPAAYPLEAGAQYHWRVRPRVQGDGIPVGWSATWMFNAP